MTMTKLKDGTPIKIAEHPTRNQRRCVVYCPESMEYSTDDLKEELIDQGVKDLRRITRKIDGKDTPTPTIILTIEGTVVPQSVNFGWIRAQTRPYYPTPMLCYGCYSYGHPRKRCTAKEPVCGICSGNHVNTPDNPCRLDPYCKHCKNNSHPVMSRKCPIYVMEVEIQHLMVDRNIGYPAARRMWDSEHRKTTAASVVSASNDARFAELNCKFDRLLIETGKKDQQLEALRQEAMKRDAQITRLFEMLSQSKQEVAMKDKKIAELEAILAAAGINVPSMSTNYTESNMENIETIRTEPGTATGITTGTAANTATGTETGTTKKTGAIKKTPKGTTEKPSTLTRKSRSRSRSRSPINAQHKGGKDGRSQSTDPRGKRHPEPTSSETKNNFTTNTQNPTGKKSKQYKAKSENSNNTKLDVTTLIISDDENKVSQKSKSHVENMDTESIGELDISSDEHGSEAEEVKL